MKALWIVIFCLSATLKADEVYRIEIGRDYQKYSDSDLRRRVWELERAVSQLQSRVFQLEGTRPPSGGDTWLCTIKVFGDSYTGTGASRPVAASKVIETCKAARGGDAFFCKDPKCEQ